MGPQRVGGRVRSGLELLMPFVPLLVAVLTLLGGGAGPAQPQGWDPLHGQTEHDEDFQDAAKMYFMGTGVDWRLLRQQAFKESSFRTDVVSHAGAQGIAQFIPSTWKAVQQAIPELQGRTPFEARAAIMGQAFLMHKYRAGWTAERSERDRMLLTAASYNAGPRRLQDAQRHCLQTEEQAAACNTWAAIIAALPSILTKEGVADEVQRYAEGIVEAVPPHEPGGPLFAHEDTPEPPVMIPKEFADQLDSLSEQELRLVMTLIALLNGQ